MREILFRGKAKSDGKWVEGDLLREKDVFGEICTRIYQIKGNDLFRKHEVYHETVCQYAGLTDKNGKKIFEGDIVRYTDEITGKEKADEVEYNETHTAFCRLHKSEMGLQYLFIDEAVVNKCEVIGNIFDNPELIGDQP